MLVEPAAAPGVESVEEPVVEPAQPSVPPPRLGAGAANNGLTPALSSSVAPSGMPERDVPAGDIGEALPLEAMPEDGVVQPVAPEALEPNDIPPPS